MFYTDFDVWLPRPHVSNYILRFADHYDEYANSHFVRTVSYDDITVQ